MIVSLECTTYRGVMTTPLQKLDPIETIAHGCNEALELIEGVSMLMWNAPIWKQNFKPTRAPRACFGKY